VVALELPPGARRAPHLNDSLSEPASALSSPSTAAPHASPLSARWGARRTATAPRSERHSAPYPSLPTDDRGITHACRKDTESFPPERAQAAARRAHFYGAYTYRGIKNILRQGLDLQPLPLALAAPASPGLAHPRFARSVAELLHPTVVPQESELESH
jgi:hypothetical protein